LKNNPARASDSPYAWFPLDNAAKIYPAVQNRENTAVFRISAILHDRVNYACLVTALGKTEARFPYFKVTLKKGFFWYYLEHCAQRLMPVFDHQGPCRGFDYKKGNALLFRVLVVKNIISVEFSHILTDGAGAGIFLSTLLEAYFAVRGSFAGDHPAIRAETAIEAEEFEDAYNRYFKSDIPPVIQYSRAFHLPFRLREKPRFHVLQAVLPLDPIKLKAREKGISITDFLVSVYLYVLQDIFFKLPLYSRFGKHKILRIEVPVNLRKIYSTKSLRNFSLFVLPEIDLRLGRYSFDEIVKIVYHKMRLETDEKLINKIITRNVGSEKNFLVRGVPLFFKNMILYLKYYSLGTRQYSGVVTNLGRIDLPEDILAKIDRLTFIPPPPNRQIKVNCGVIGFKDKLMISFGNITVSREVEAGFFRFLTDQGIPVKLTSYD
jgi:NRPS condensation-like uncharacterized protein